MDDNAARFADRQTRFSKTLLLLLPAFALFFVVCARTIDAQDSPIAEYPMPATGHDLLGGVVEVRLRHEDTFAAVAREQGVGYDALRRVNPDIDPWLPSEGALATIPSAYLLPAGPRSGLVINLSERRLYQYDETSGSVRVFPVGIGREGFDTPEMKTRTVAKIENPTWTPPESIRAEHVERGSPLPATVPPGPNNPLGRYAIGLAAPGYFLHGTNQPIGVGRRVSHGCIRLYASHIRHLIDTVDNGTEVTIVEQPIKVGWHNGVLYLEAHPDGTEPGQRNLTGVVRKILAAAGTASSSIDWDLATNAALEAQGLPISILRADR